MSRRYNGVQALIFQELSLAYYTHCTAHRVNLVAQYVSELECIRSILTIVEMGHEIGQLYSNSIKFRNTFTYCKLKTLCPTRWTKRKVAIQDILTYYKEMYASLYEMIHRNDITSDQYDKFRSIMKKLDGGNIYLGLKVALRIFEHLDILVKSMMVTNNTLDSVNDSLQLCSRSLNIVRNSYSTLFHEKLSEIQNFAFIEDITNKRKRKANI